MQSQAFAAAVRPAPRRILRVWLQPYSLGHEILLLGEGNSLLLDPEEFDALPLTQRIFAIIRAAQICSRTWAQNHKPDTNLYLWFWLIRRDDKEKACREFRGYRNEGSTFPAMGKSKCPESERSGSPLAARLLDYASDRWGAAALDLPLGMIQWLYFAHAEADGGCNVKNDYQLRLEVELAEHEAAFRKEQCQH
jgi:hypothetical protein